MTVAPEIFAQQAGLAYVDTEADPGITRHRCGRGFTFRDADKRLIRGERRERLLELAIPPAWRDVWISPNPDAHILAVGRDDKGRKQYIYNPRWNLVRSQARYHGLVDFAEALPTVRARVAEDLGGDPTSLNAVLALGIRLIDATLVRVGNESYARQNGSRGLTTLEKEHVHISSSGALVLEFPGKSGVERSLEIDDPELAELLYEVLDTDADRVLAWDDGGVMRPVTPAQLNAYLAELSGGDHTVKTFRTWGGTVIATSTFLERGPCPGEGRERTECLASALDAVAARLGNTRAVCRDHYVHPGVIDAYADGTLRQLARRRSRLSELSRDERVTLGVCRALREASAGTIITDAQAA